MDGWVKKSVEVSFDELVMGAVYQVTYKFEELPEKEPDICVEKADISDEITAYKDFSKIPDQFENPTMKIPNCVTKKEKFSRTVSGKWKNHLKWKKSCKFRKKTRLKRPRKTCAKFT